MSRQATKSGEPLRVLQITDTHLFADAATSLRGRVTYLTLQQVLDHVQQAAWPADLVSVTGDLIQDDTREAYLRFRSAMSALGLPVYCIPGNHDVRSLMRDVLDSEPFYYCEPAERNNWLMVGLDSCAEGIAAGRMSGGELDRLDRIIAGSAAEHVMICLHHPPLPVGSNWLEEVGLQNADQFLQRAVASGRVRLLVFGHVHQAFEGSYESMRVIGTPSTCRQFAVGSDNYAVDDKSPAYRRIELRSDGSFDSELIWTNA